MRYIRRFVVAASLAAMPSLAAQPQRPAVQDPGATFVARAVRASLHGIVLTDAERTALATVSTRYTPKFKAITDSAKPVTAQLRAARGAKDTAAAHAARKRLRELQRSRMDVLRQSLRDVRAVLTPEHQSHFDANGVRVRLVIRRHLRAPLRPARNPRVRPPTPS